MIKPRSLSSHFELQAEAQPGNFEGKLGSHSSDSFNQMKVGSMLPVAPMENVTTPAIKDRGSKVGKPTNPIISSPVYLVTITLIATSLTRCDHPWSNH